MLKHAISDCSWHALGARRRSCSFHYCSFASLSRSLQTTQNSIEVTASKVNEQFSQSQARGSLEIEETSDRETWHSLTIMVTAHREKSMTNGFSSRKDLLRTNPTRKEAKQLKAKATIRFRHSRPYEQDALPMSTIGKVRTIAVHQGPCSMT